MHGIGLALVAAALFGASTPASKLLLRHFGPFQLAGLLYLGAALGMWVPLARERRDGVSARWDPRSRWLLAGAIAAGGVVSSGAGWPGWLAAAWVAGACACWGSTTSSPR